MSDQKASYFQSFKQTVDQIPLPHKFTYPFYYEPSEISKLAARELQEYLSEQSELNHNFGLDKSFSGSEIGKMFGVLVVENNRGEIGYLAAFSGKLGGKNQHSRFVPPVFDMLTEDGFFLKNEKELNGFNHTIEQLEQNSDYLKLKHKLSSLVNQSIEQISLLKKQIADRKKQRKILREEYAKTHEYPSMEKLLEELRIESLKEQYALKDQKKVFKEQIDEISSQVEKYKQEIDQLKQERKLRSSALQKELFNAYSFLNILGESKSLMEIFKQYNDSDPPSAAGECAAPKLLQYAFIHKLKPIALAEFWWGKSPLTEIRKHRQFYPSCRGKCEPILTHMLAGMPLDDNPLIHFSKSEIPLEILFEDEYLVIINKPIDLLSVPGIHVEDSVYSRVRTMYPNSTGPLLVHRLDMSTSGILLIAKSKDIHQKLQRQFINRSIQKHYVALLDGLIESDEGTIDLPLRVDLDDRPRQLVCYMHGKKAITKWKVLERTQSKTRIRFEPITGRTHQLRVHAAHPLGLNTPILGDDLYGIKKDRLHLHASFLGFVHPKSGASLSFESKADF